MKNKTILIAETNKPQDKFIKEALIRNNVNVKIIDNIPINCRELMDSIISLKPDIVVTNERKTDGLASDVISEIQKNKNIKQPMFILVSGYSKNDMEYVVNNKGIDVHIIIKPYNFDDLAHLIFFHWCFFNIIRVKMINLLFFLKICYNRDKCNSIED